MNRSFCLAGLRLHRLLAAWLLLLATIAPAHARVTVTFWSQEFGHNFPHAFFTLYGTTETDNRPVDVSYGFTPKTISPAVLMGDVIGRIDLTADKYIARSDAHFSVSITDAQYAALEALAVEWSDKGDPTYSLNRRNCVHFVAEAMRRAGLRVEEPKKLMKKPRSFTRSIGTLNASSVVTIEKPAAEYLASLPPLSTAGGTIAVAR